MTRVVVNPGEARGYSLDFRSVVTDVAVALETAREADNYISLEQIADALRPLGPDLHRVKRNENYTTDTEAKKFLAEAAIKALGNRVDHGVTSDDVGGYRLARPLRQLRFQNKPLRARSDPHAVLQDAFDRNKEGFIYQRKDELGSLDDLRASMGALGWLESYPAIVDEHGEVLNGRRRIAVAKELGIEPVIKRIRFGEGDAADAQRYAVVIAGNNLSSEDQALISKALLGNEKWDMPRLGEALRNLNPNLPNVITKPAEKPKRHRSNATCLVPECTGQAVHRLEWRIRGPQKEGGRRDVISGGTGKIGYSCNEHLDQLRAEAAKL